MAQPHLRRSQLVTTFGPGSMIDLPDSSVIVAGLDHWRYDAARIPLIEEPRLVEKLRTFLDRDTVTLRSPPSAPEHPGEARTDVTAWEFPNWFIVQEPRPAAGRSLRRRLVHAAALEKGRFRDADSRAALAVVPVRFVRACPRGHVADLDWKGFVHGGRTDCMRQLWIEERGTSGDLAQVFIACDCGISRSIAEGAGVGALGACNGGRPWLGAGQTERCDLPARLLVRSASNAYFPQLLSVISIPDIRRPIDDAVRALWADFLADVESFEELAKVRKKPTPAERLQGFTDTEVFAAIERQRGGSAESQRKVKDVEFAALSEAAEELGADVPGGDFYARRMPRPLWDAPWMKGVSDVVLVHRLREVVALAGFTRCEPQGPDIQGELSIDAKRAALAVDQTWVPAIENRGEGVFLRFDAAAIGAWVARPEVISRARVLEAGFDAWKGEKKAKLDFPNAIYYMLHSFSHLLMTAISLECGYPASSIRERVFCMPHEGHFGVLIYTGSSDAEGTLGGLVVAGRSIARHVRRALEEGSLCSSDPVCAYHRPGEHDHQPLHGAACHGCLLVAETSCEQHNDYLDRALVVPTVEGLGVEFFGGVG
jgi:hypothetical protein